MIAFAVMAAGAGALATVISLIVNGIKSPSAPTIPMRKRFTQFGEITIGFVATTLLALLVLVAIGIAELLGAL